MKVSQGFLLEYVCVIMSKITWIIEDCFSSDTNPLLEEVANLNDEIVILDCPAYMYQDEINKIPNDKIVFGYCSLGLAKFIRTRFNPGVFYNPTAYDCTSYYPAFGNFLLNSTYIMLPYGELIRKKEFLYNTLGQDNTIFVRPNGGGKTFTGELIYKEKYDDRVPHLGYGEIKQEELVVVSEPRNIINEWRLVIKGNEIVASSLYKRNHLHIMEEGCPEKLKNFVIQNVLPLYNPDPIWILDMCETSSGYYVLEIGCFSCAGLYYCNRKDVVLKVREAILKEHECE